jgi:hypothetical protein
MAVLGTNATLIQKRVAPLCVGIVFMRGNPSAMGDNVIMQATWGPFVHTEFLMMDSHNTKTYTALGAFNRRDQISGFTRTEILECAAIGPHLITMNIPVEHGLAGYNKVKSFIMQLLTERIPYNYKDLWQCCFKALLSYEEDVACSDPKSWKDHGVFCSQACLLILRWLCREGLVKLPDVTRDLIESTHSRGCSPNTLFRIMTATTKKNTY